jgi:TRAP-type C4-dicarboxylate transport system substrate-binding protein
MVGAFTLVGCAAPPPPTTTPTPVPAPISAPVKPIELKVFNHEPPNSFINQTFDQWINEVKKRTAGRVILTNYPAQTLGKQQDQWEMLKKGVGDVSWIFPVFYKGVFPLSDVANLFFLLPDRSVPTANQLYDKYLYREWDAVKVLWPDLLSAPVIHTAKKPVRTLTDLRGMQLRCAPGLEAKSVQALGATPVSIPMPEIYPSLERGVIEGATASWNAVYSQKLYEITKYSTDVPLCYAFTTVSMNLNTWNSLPPDIQKIFNELSPWAQQLQHDLMDKEVEQGRAKAKEKGNEFINLSSAEKAKWAEAVKPVIDDWAAEMDKQGLQGTAAVNFCRSK